MAEEKLVHPIVTARTLPHGDREETNTRMQNEGGGIQIHILILSFFYLNADAFTPVSVTHLKRSSRLFSNSKAAFTV